MTPRALSGILIALLSVAIAVSHHVAMEEFLYWRFWWFDVLMHLAGGIFFGAAFSWGARFELPLKYQDRWFRLFPILGAVLLVGVAWEVFEVYAGIAANLYLPYVLDTLKDIADDLAGGAIGYMLVKYVFR